MHDPPRKIYRFDGYRLDPLKRKLERDGQSIHLPAKAFDLLVVMAENSSTLMERERLFELLWPGQFVEESNLSVTVSALRKALGERKGEERYILTIPRQGYRFIADVTSDESLTEPDAVASAEQLAVSPNISPNGKSVSSRPLHAAAQPVVRQEGWRGTTVIAGLVFLLLAAAGLGYWQFVSGDQEKPEFGSGQMSIRRLTSHGKVVRATLSPEGKYFAYVREEQGGRSLWLGQTADGSSIQLRSPSEIVFGSIVFAPDGNSIYCVGTSKGKPHSVLYRMSILGTRTETVLERIDSPPAFSPDGSQIAFIRHSGEKRESGLFVANANDGNNETVLATREWRKRFTGGGLAWSPDGGLIAATAMTDNDNSTDRVVLGVRPSDGSVIALTNQKWGGIHRLTWLKDGSGIVMVATDKSAFEWLQLWHLSFPESEAHRITRDLTTYNQSSLSLSSDNSAMLAVQLQQTNNIWVAPSSDLEQARQVTFGSPGRLDGAYGLDWLPDGKIIYAAVSGEGMSIWRIEPESGETAQLTRAGYVERRVSVTSDGRYMVFESDRSGNPEVWRSDTDGDHQTQLTAGGNNRSPHVAPDGRWVVFATTNAGVTTIRRVSIDGGAPVDLTHQESDWPRISRDGKRFVCILRTSLDSPWQLAVFDINGGPPIKLFALPETANYQNGLQWTPDGSAITYRDWNEGIWLQNLDKDAPERISGLPKEKLYPYAWSPDGKWFAYTRGAENYDVVLITDFK